MPQRLLIAGNDLESLLNETRKMFYSLYQSKEISKKYATTKLNPSNYKQ